MMVFLYQQALPTALLMEIQQGLRTAIAIQIHTTIVTLIRPVQLIALETQLPIQVVQTGLIALMALRAILTQLLFLPVLPTLLPEEHLYQRE